MDLSIFLQETDSLPIPIPNLPAAPAVLSTIAQIQQFLAGRPPSDSFA